MNSCEFYLPIPILLVEIVIFKESGFKTSQPGSNAQYHLSIKNSRKMLLPSKTCSLKDKHECLLMISCEFYLFNYYKWSNLFG